MAGAPVIGSRSGNGAPDASRASAAKKPQRRLDVPGRPCALERQRGQELLGAVLAVRDQPGDERGVAVELRHHAQPAGQARPRQLDHTDHDRAVPAVARERALLEQLVDLLDEPQLLVQGEVARQLVAPVGDLDRPTVAPSPGAVGLIWMTQISSGSASTSSRTGGFCENSPSQ